MSKTLYAARVRGRSSGLKREGGREGGKEGLHKVDALQTYRVLVLIAWSWARAAWARAG